MQAEKHAHTAAKWKATQDVKKKKVHQVVREPELEDGAGNGKGRDSSDLPPVSDVTQGAVGQKHCHV